MDSKTDGKMEKTNRRKEWIIRDVNDGYERTTEHMPVHKFNFKFSGLRERLADKATASKEFFTQASAIILDVWAKEPALLLVVALSGGLDAAYVALSTYCEAKIVMITQEYVTHGMLPVSSILFCLALWISGTLLKKHVSDKNAFHFGRFRLLYNTAIEKTILDASVDVDLEELEKESTQELLKASKKLVVTDTSVWASPLLPETVINLVVNSVMLPIRLTVMLFVIPRSTLPLVVALSLWMWRGSSIYEVLTGGPDWAWANRTTSMCNPALVRMKRLFELGTDKSRAKDAALLGISGWIRDEYVQSSESLAPSTASTLNRVNSIRVHHEWDLMAVAQPFVELALLVIAHRYSNLELSAAVYAIVKSTSTKCLDGLQQVKRTQNDLKRQMQQYAALQDLVKLGNGYSVKETCANLVMQNATSAKPGLAIELRNVSFAYPNQGEQQKKDVLKNLSATIPAGSLVAVVGFNGAGKSSLISILGRAYDVQSGAVLVNGQDVKTLKRKELASLVSILPQNSTLFDVSLKENIAFEDCHNENVYRRAAQASGARSFIEKLDQSYDASPACSAEKIESFRRLESLKKPCTTDHVKIIDEDGNLLRPGARELIPTDLDMSKESNRKALTKYLTHDFKPGVKFSGGELQKIVLSRAFAKPDSQLVVFDEPASNLDPESEHQLFAEISALKGTKTIVYISHRWKGITDRADLVLLMEEGTIKEEGTHRSLMEKDGAYARLWRLQTEGGGLASAEEEESRDEERKDKAEEMTASGQALQGIRIA